ncbi:MAG: Septum site-determining protein MinD, partial [Planctomycetota bacterium]
LSGVTGLLRVIGQPSGDSATTVILVMPESGEVGYEAVSALGSVPGCRLLLVGGIADSRAVLRAMRLGATEYLDRAELVSELSNALDRIDQRRLRAYSIGVFSAAGGAGCSSVTASLGCELAKKPGSCALLDLKVEGGDLATLLNLKVPHTLADLSRNVDGLDATALKTCLVGHESGVQLLSATADFPGFAPVDTRAVQRVLSLLSRQVQYVVLDLDRCLNHATFTMAQAVDVLVCVMRPDYVSLRRTKLMLDWMSESGLDRGKLRLVLNRTGWSGEVSAAQVSDALQLPVGVDIADDPKSSLRAVNAGVPMLLSAPSSKFSRRLTQLAEEMRGVAAKRGV